MNLPTLPKPPWRAITNAESKGACRQFDFKHFFCCLSSLFVQKCQLPPIVKGIVRSNAEKWALLRKDVVWLIVCRSIVMCPNGMVSQLAGGCATRGAFARRGSFCSRSAWHRAFACIVTRNGGSSWSNGPCRLRWKRVCTQRLTRIQSCADLSAVDGSTLLANLSKSVSCPETACLLRLSPMARARYTSFVWRLFLSIIQHIIHHANVYFAPL